MSRGFEVNSIEYKAVNWGSVVSCLIILLYVLFLSKCMMYTNLYIEISRPAYLDRVSLKIQVAIALTDIIRHLNYIYGSSPNDLICKTSAFLTFFTTHVTTFLNVAIALNLQIIYLHEKIPSHRLGPFLYTIPILVALIIDSIPIYLKAYGKDYSNFCSIDKDNGYRESIKIGLMYVGFLPGIVYCFIVPVLLMLKLYLIKPIPENDQNPELRPLLRAVQNPISRTLGLRVSLYPLAYSLCHSGVIITSMYVSITGKESSLVNWSYFGISIVGIVNLLCFIINPYIQESWNPPHLIIDEQGENDSIQGSYQNATGEDNNEENSAFNISQSSDTLSQQGLTSQGSSQKLSHTHSSDEQGLEEDVGYLNTSPVKENPDGRNTLKVPVWAVLPTGKNSAQMEDLTPGHENHQFNLEAAGPPFIPLEGTCSLGKDTNQSDWSRNKKKALSVFLDQYHWLKAAQAMSGRLAAPPIRLERPFYYS